MSSSEQTKESSEQLPKVSKENFEPTSEEKEEEGKRLFERLTPNQREGIVAYMETQMTIRSGPLPSADELDGYEKVLPGAADRIIKMAENQARHRQNLENKAVDAGIGDSKRGQYFAFILALIAVVGGIVLIFFDKALTGFGLVVGSVASLVGVFIYGRKSEIKERTEKNKE